MNYNHAYHAGSAADILKQLSLLIIAEYLAQKDKGIIWIDTHGGHGLYSLDSLYSAKTQEAELGIHRLWPTFIANHEPLIQAYIHILKNYYPQHFPGSPLFIAHLLRPQDRLIVAETQEDPCTLLKRALQSYAPHSRSIIRQENGYALLKSQLPSPTGRAVIMMDPPYEDPLEWTHIQQAYQEGLNRMPHAIFMLWYPYQKNRLKSHQGLEALRLLAEKYQRPYAEHRLQDGRSGLFIINPPWIWKKKIEEITQVCTI